MLGVPILVMEAVTIDKSDDVITAGCSDWPQRSDVDIINDSRRSPGWTLVESRPHIAALLRQLIK